MGKLDKDSVAYRKYVSRWDKNSPENLARVKQEKAERRRKWWAQNWIALLGVLFAFIAALPTIYQVIEAILKLLQ